MQSLRAKRGVVSTIVLLLVATVNIAVQAADAPLATSGTGTIHSAFKGDGTTTQIGQNRLYWTGAYWGFSFNDAGKGFLHQMAWHCPAITDIHNGLMTTKGACTLTDAEGDKLYGDWTGKGAVGGEFAGNLTISDGTGKFAKMQGGWDFHCWGVGTDAQLYCHQTYNYTLP